MVTAEQQQRRSFEGRSSRQSGRPIDVQALGNALPPTLAELVDQKRVTGHRRLMERAQKARQAELDASAAVEKARKADQDNTTAAALANKPLPAATLPGAEQKLAQAAATRSALEGAVIESADDVLNVALPSLEEAAAQAEERIAAAEEKRTDLLRAAMAAGDTVAGLRAEADWIRGARTSVGRLRPFSGPQRPDEVNAALRTALGTAEAQIERRERERERAERERRHFEETVGRRQELDRQGKLPGRPGRVVTSSHGIAGTRVEPASDE